MGTIAPSYMWKTGAICVNQEGNRFVDETSQSVEERELALEEQTNAIQYDIFTDNISVYPNPVQDRLYIETQTLTLTQTNRLSNSSYPQFLSSSNP